MLGIDHHDIGYIREHGNRREVALDVVGQLGVDTFGDGVVNGTKEKGVTIGRCLGCLSRADRSARAGDVFDKHRLPEGLRQFGRKRPPEGIDAAAGGERIDQFDRFAWPGLSRCRDGCQRDKGGGKQG